MTPNTVRTAQLPTGNLVLVRNLEDGGGETFRILEALYAAKAPPWALMHVIRALAAHGEQPAESWV